jgi:hypothetical protein
VSFNQRFHNVGEIFEDTIDAKQCRVPSKRRGLHDEPLPCFKRNIKRKFLSDRLVSLLFIIGSCVHRNIPDLLANNLAYPRQIQRIYAWRRFLYELYIRPHRLRRIVSTYKRPEIRCGAIYFHLPFCVNLLLTAKLRPLQNTLIRMRSSVAGFT